MSKRLELWERIRHRKGTFTVKELKSSLPSHLRAHVGPRVSGLVESGRLEVVEGSPFRHRRYRIKCAGRKGKKWGDKIVFGTPLMVWGVICRWDHWFTAEDVVAACKELNAGDGTIHQRVYYFKVQGWLEFTRENPRRYRVRRELLGRDYREVEEWVVPEVRAAEEPEEDWSHCTPKERAYREFRKSLGKLEVPEIHAGAMNRDWTGQMEGSGFSNRRVAV